MKNLFLSNRFFYVLSGVIALFVLSFPFGFLFPVAQTALVLALAASISDIYLLFNPAVQLKVRRYLPKVFSLGDDNRVQIVIENLSSLNLSLVVIDELPVQFQRRDFEAKLKLTPGNEKKITYQLRPVARGEYSFGDINLFLSSFLGLVQRRYQHHYPMNVPVYPSILQMKKFELKAFNRTSHSHGIKKIRRLGHSYEFEQIKNYVQGDDFRSINWKASSRRGTFMVNQYQDERAQQVYNIIDKGRAMKMPFNGLSLIDYAINTTLVISNVALQKYDRAGLISFSDKIGSTIKAEKKPHQLNKILTALYKEQERNMESNFELLYYSSRKLIKGRSLLFLYTNFESIYAMERVMPILRKINNLHLLVVIFFENTEVKDYAKLAVTTTEEIYLQTIAQKFVAEKVQMVQTLKQYGIQAILTAPEELSVNTINKYLELKSRGLI